MQGGSRDSTPYWLLLRTHLKYKADEKPDKPAAALQLRESRGPMSESF